jgi:hypothetical protein
MPRSQRHFLNAMPYENLLGTHYLTVGTHEEGGVELWVKLMSQARHFTYLLEKNCQREKLSAKSYVSWDRSSVSCVGSFRLRIDTSGALASFR